LEEVIRFIGTALKAENAAIVVATESHRDTLLLQLQTYGLDVGKAIDQGRYIALDAADALSALMLGGMPDPVQFMGTLGHLIKKATAAAKEKHARVSIFGECVQLLWAQGNPEAAIRFEKLGNQLANMYPLDILCGYSLGRAQREMDSHTLQRIRAEHSAVHFR
jgi:KaiC/GvpD/RAD55 family RecA-like ATPase